MVSRTIEVDLDEFDDDAIVEAAREIVARRGQQPIEGIDMAARDVRLVAKYIARGDNDYALIALEHLVRTDRILVEAVDIGRRER